jgi:hypothetical protein
VCACAEEAGATAARLVSEGSGFYAARAVDAITGALHCCYWLLSVVGVMHEQEVEQEVLGVVFVPRLEDERGGKCMYASTREEQN